MKIIGSSFFHGKKEDGVFDVYYENDGKKVFHGK